MIERSARPRLLALSGDALTAPADTPEAYWAALASGEGLAVTVRLTADRVPVCCAERSLAATTGDSRRVGEVTAVELALLDAGARFRSTVLNAENRPTGERGGDYPWAGAVNRRRRLTHPTVWETLRLFGRRCEVVLLLAPELSGADGEEVLAVVAAAGLSRAVTIAGSPDQLISLAARSPHTPRALIARDPVAAIPQAKQLGARYLVAPFAAVFPAGDRPDEALLGALKQAALELILCMDGGTPALPSACAEALRAPSPLTVLLAPGPLATAAVLNQQALMVREKFSGTSIDRDLWSAGYSRANQDSAVYQDDGLHIRIREGGEYSGAAAVCRLPVHGSFDARVGFHVENPHQGTTFEMAAIGIDPGAFHIDNRDLDSRTVNLTFDVHGAPPYASSERDEDDGFRCGWNNGFSLTRIDPDWNASSANMYNKYGRGVGNGRPDQKEGELRLVRNGPVFAAFYRDSHNAAWVNSGAMLVHNLSSDVFIRLGAKHWKKNNWEPPGNHVVFHTFELYQW